MQNGAGEIERTGSIAAEVEAQRTLFTVAVRDYPDSEEGFAEGIDDQLAIVREWWSAYRQVSAPELQSRHDIERFLERENVREISGQALVLFVTGHGMTGTSQTHFLQLPQTNERRKLATAIRTCDIVTAALDSHAENVLVIVNTCYANALQSELPALYKEIQRSRRTTCKLDVLATCDHDSPVQVLRFSTVLRGVWNRLRTTAGITTPHLSVATLMAEFENELGTDAAKAKHRLHRVIDGSGQTRTTPCLPNPGYRLVRELVGSSLQQLATPADDYWLDRASGRPQEHDSGWYFRGRNRLNRQLTAFLQPSELRGVMLVTGTAGSGKSAVIARAVTLSDPLFRENALYKDALEDAEPDTVPPEGSVTTAVLARHRMAEDVVADILRGLGLAPKAPDVGQDAVAVWSAQLTCHLRSAHSSVTIVVDGLDEALEPHRIIDDVLAPLSPFCTPALAAPAVLPGQRKGHQAAALRLLVGVRSSRPVTQAATPPADNGEHGLLDTLRGVFPAAVVERTDDPASEDDIVDYLHALICADGRHRDTALSAARAVAPLVWPSFLDARLAGEQLRTTDDPAAAVSEPQWQRTLQAGTTGLLQRDLMLVEADGLPPDVALALLRASAYALGTGVPWSTIWPTMAGPFLGRPLDSPDLMIEKLLDSRLNGYLAHDHEDDRRVYRPAHEALAETLRDLNVELLHHEEPA
ncbi:ATP-binding protein [Streptomyces sp. NPDC048196]|uniref:ATP-binding protein n=1 Tax=Streptomyces sp. NPDC048196 TaxID=3154712 RepID=UPI0033DB81E9